MDMRSQGRVLAHAARALFVALAVLWPHPASWAAQAVRGTLLGNVTDQTGLPIPGATVTAIEINTNIAAVTTTNESGYYTFNVKDGDYRVEVRQAGFKTAVRADVAVPVNVTARVDFQMDIGDIQESLVVVGARSVLQTDRADIGRTIDGVLVERLPLAFNRNFQGILATVPGATRPARQHSEFFNAHDSLSTNVNGQSRLANNEQIEGVDNNHRTGLLTILIPSAEAIASVSVSTSNYDAEFGRAGGAVTNVTLKSGTNTLKGSAFAYGHTEATMASGYFSRTKPPTDYLQSGVTLGGPLRRDRIFFFSDYQYTRDNRGGTARAALPPDAFRRGDFSGAPTIIYDPATGNPDGTGRRPFPGNIIPPGRISPVALAILAQLPAANLDAAPGQVNHQASYVREKVAQAFNLKVNQQTGVSDQLSARLSFQRPRLVDPPIFGRLGGGGKPFAGTGTNVTYSVGANYTRVWSSSLVMEARGGFNYYHNVATSAGAGEPTAQELGIPGVNLDEWTSGMTGIDISGFTSPLVGFDSSLPWDRSERTLQFATVFTRSARNHLIKFGHDVRRNRDFLLQTQENGGPRGRFQFRGPQTATVGDTAAQNGFANAFAAFLLDVPAGLGRELRVLDTGTRQWSIFTFIQDKWQISPNVTLDIGLRHEFYAPLVGLTGQGGLSNYDPATNALHVAGYGDVDPAVGVGRYFGNFAPRTGVSYRIDDRSVLRGGYGVSTIPFPDNAYAFNFPVRQSNQITPPNTFAAAGSMAAGFPDPVVLAIPPNGIIDAGSPALRTQAFTHVPPDLHEGALHSWNVAYQRELPGGWTAEAAYVGNRGRDIVATMNMNAGLVLGADNAGRPLFARFGRTAEVSTWVPVKSTYHALQAKLDRRLSGGLMVTTSYTLGRGRNYSVGDSNGNIQTPADPERSWARRGEDRLHSFTAGWVYDIPIGGLQRYAAARRIAGSWQFSGLLVAQSGRPINFEANNATLRAPGNRQRPDASGRPRVLGGVGPGQLWFDTSVFSAPALNTWGNVARNSLLDGPGVVTVDAALAKALPLSRGVRGELRIEGFNVLNTPHWDNPEGSLGNAAFGQIVSVVPFSERVVRFGFRLTF